ncbi:MAG: transposase [Candidatus Methanomethylophilaceae archaeon]|jgi:transposase
MKETYRQVKDDLTYGSTMIFDAGANQKDILDSIIDDDRHFLTRKKLNKSDDKLFAQFSEETWECIDAEKGEYCLKKMSPSRVNYYFFSGELYDLEMKGMEKKALKKLKEAKSLQDDIEKGKKLKKRYQIDNVLIKATISLQTKLTEISDDEALDILREKGTTGREGFFCLVSDRDMDPLEVRTMYRSKDIAEKLFSSMKSDIGVRPIKTWTENGVYGVLLIGFLAQAMVSVTRILSEPVSSRAT